MLFAKGDIKGAKAQPLWLWLRRPRDGKPAVTVSWNFGKFIVDKAGNVHSYHPPSVDPDDLMETIEKVRNL